MRLHPAFAGFQKRDQLRGGDFRDGLAGEEVRKPLHLPANPVHLRHGELVLRELAFLGGDIFRRRLDQRLLLLRFLVVAQREIDVERKRARQRRHAAENHLGFAHLIFGERGCDRAHTFRGLRGLDFERGFFRGRFFARREVLPNADTVQPAGHTP